MTAAAPPAAVTAVTVTRGGREAQLAGLLEACRAAGVGRVVVVCNGGAPSSGARGAEIVALPDNAGSAGGYAAGLTHALQLGANYVWLLDDDNRPAPDALPRLLQAHARLRAAGAAEPLAVAARRPAYHRDGAAPGRPKRPGSFRGFHVADLLAGRRRQGRGSAVPELADAPYGGLLFHRDLVAAIGLPRADFVLYADDLEFTSRIPARGGRLVRVDDALVDDAEPSWAAAHAGGRALLRADDELRVYYSVRNRAWLDARRGGSAALFALNRALYLGRLAVLAVATGRGARLRLIRRAIDDGVAGRLGVNPAFPMPS